MLTTKPFLFFHHSMQYKIIKKFDSLNHIQMTKRFTVSLDNFYFKKPSMYHSDQYFLMKFHKKKTGWNNWIIPASSQTQFFWWKYMRKYRSE